MNCVFFDVLGDPVGKGRPRFTRRGSHVTTYTPKKTASYEAHVATCAKEAMGLRPAIAVAVQVVICLYVVPPARFSKRKRESALAGEVRPVSSPDLDNVAKGILDAMNKIVFDDDRQVCSLSVSKHFAECAKATITVIEI